MTLADAGEQAVRGHGARPMRDCRAGRRCRWLCVGRPGREDVELWASPAVTGARELPRRIRARLSRASTAAARSASVRRPRPARWRARDLANLHRRDRGLRDPRGRASPAGAARELRRIRRRFVPFAGSFSFLDDPRSPVEHQGLGSSRPQPPPSPRMCSTRRRRARPPRPRPRPAARAPGRRSRHRDPPAGVQTVDQAAHHAPLGLEIPRVGRWRSRTP